MKVGNLVRFLAGASLSVLASINVNISKEIKSVCQRVIEKFAYRQIYTLDLENACLHTCNLHRNTHHSEAVRYAFMHTKLIHSPLQPKINHGANQFEVSVQIHTRHIQLSLKSDLCQQFCKSPINNRILVSEHFQPMPPTKLSVFSNSAILRPSPQHFIFSFE